MLSYKNRIYGLVIGGAISDSIGAVAAYAPDLPVTDPFSAQQVGIKPGYWTEPTGLFLTTLRDQVQGLESGRATIMNCTGKVAKYNYRILPCIAQSSVLCLVHDMLEVQIQNISVIAPQLELSEAPVVKLWIAIIDGVLHGLPKRSLFNPILYKSLDLPSKILDLLRSSSGDLDAGDLEEGEINLVLEVLRVFRSTDNFVKGLKVIVNTSVAPTWTGTLYGQLAGAYYGITDIPESWMDVVQRSDDILALTERVTDTSFQGIGTDSIVSAKETHITTESSGDIATI